MEFESVFAQDEGEDTLTFRERLLLHNVQPEDGSRKALLAAPTTAHPDLHAPALQKWPEKPGPRRLPALRPEYESVFE